MRILLSNPPWFTEDGKRWGIRAGSRWPFTTEAGNRYLPFPFLMAYAASYLQRKGVEAHLVDSIHVFPISFTGVLFLENPLQHFSGRAAL